MKKTLLLGALCLLTACTKQQDQPIEDPRQYAHGVAIIGDTVLWSEKSDEQRKDGGWTHDIYKKQIQQKNIETLLANPEAQEPVSASATDETIIITYEDGYDAKNNIAQRFKLYNHKWQLLHEGTVFDGGHSGHVASTKSQHIVFWSNDWVNGGGVNELGTGKEVIVSTISTDGALLHETKISQANDRDSWPLLAASDDNALLIWQHFNDAASEAALYFALYNPSKNLLTVAPTELVPQVKFYTYSVSFVPTTNQYVIAAQTDSGGQLFLLSKNGELLDQIDVPDLVNEATPAIKDNLLVFPQMPASYFTVQIVNNKLHQKASYTLDVTWQTIGTAGVFVDSNHVYFATLNEKGLQEIFFTLEP